MKNTYVKFWHCSTGMTKPIMLIPACGSDTIHKLDGRLSLENQIMQARLIARRYEKRGYVAMRLIKKIDNARRDEQPLTKVISSVAGERLMFEPDPEYL